MICQPILEVFQIIETDDILKCRDRKFRRPIRFGLKSEGVGVWKDRPSPLAVRISPRLPPGAATRRVSPVRAGSCRRAKYRRNKIRGLRRGRPQCADLRSIDIARTASGLSRSNPAPAQWAERGRWFVCLAVDQAELLGFCQRLCHCFLKCGQSQHHNRRSARGRPHDAVATCRHAHEFEPGCVPCRNRARPR